MLAPQVSVADGVSWGLGVGLQGTDDSAAIWHWGDNTGYKSFAIVQLRSGDGLVYLSNSDHGMSIVHEVLAQAFGGEQAAVTHLDYQRHDAPRRLVRLALDSAMMAGGPRTGIPRYHELKRQYPASAFDVDLLQDIARLVMGAGFVEDAVQLLVLNRAEYPAEWKPHASLGDAYARLDRMADAIASYERALSLNPEREEIREKLAELRSRR
jgi:tetratricopeptide (TPR) repeat protein